MSGLEGSVPSMLPIAGAFIISKARVGVGVYSMLELYYRVYDGILTLPFGGAPKAGHGT